MLGIDRTSIIRSCLKLRNQVFHYRFHSTTKMAGQKYPKHVWSPSGGWYAQPKNWKANTFAVGAVIVGITAMTWNLSANKEERTVFPEPGRFYPSRYWSKQVIEHEKALKEGGN